MDSHQFLGCKRGGYSKAQMCLQKIIAIICSVPPHHLQNSKPKPSFHHHLIQVLDSSSSSNSQDKAQPSGHRGFRVDLNLELTSSPEIENSSVGMASTQANSNQEKSAKEENSFQQEAEEGSLPLLTETGELSSENVEFERGELGGELGTQEINGKESMKEGRRECRRVVDLYGRFDEVSQVVRTKRERRRVLPCRYKDSVLQPLARNAGSRKRQRFKVMK